MSELLRRKQVADQFGITVRSLDRIADLPRVKVGRAVRYRQEDVDRWVDGHRVSRYGLGVEQLAEVSA